MRFLLTALLLLAVSTAGAKNFAGDIISLTIWKLTIPLDDDGDGVADEVVMPLLRYFEDPDFFHLSEAGGSVIFRAACDAVRNEGDAHPRTELRELTKSGAEPASWSTTSGSHNLTVEFAINAAPKKNPKVAAIKIEDAESELLAVRFDGERLYLDRRDEEDFVLEENYFPGTFVKLMIIADNGRIRVFNGSTQILEYEVEAEGLFYKVGCFTEATSEEGEPPHSYGETEFRSVYVMHK